MEDGYCSCPRGVTCGPCHHKSAVMQHYQVAGQSVLPYNDPESRAAYHIIGTGEAMPAAWYRQIDRPDEIIDVAGVLENMEDTDNIADPPADAHLEDGLTDDVIDVSISTVPPDNDGPSIIDLLAKLKISLGNFENMLTTKAQDNPDDMKKCITKFSNTLDKLSASNNLGGAK